MKVIQVGMGGMGNAWLKAVLESEHVSHAGFVEVNDAIARAQADQYGLDPARIYKTIEAAIAAGGADGVIDVTPPVYHRDVSIAALDAGLPVLSEKPLSDTRDAAQAIVRKAAETGVLHMVAQNYRYSVPAQTLAAVLNSGRLGQVGAVAIDFFKGPHFGGYREQMPYPLIIDMSIHHFDMLRCFLERDVVSVFGRSWNPSWSWFKGDASASVLLDFEGGIAATYNASWCATGAETPWNGHWRFECERGVLLLRDDEVYVQETAGALERIEPVTMARTAQAYLLHEFYECVTNGTRPPTTCDDNIKSLGIVFDVVESFETGSRVESTREPV